MHLAGRITRELVSRLPARFELEDLESAGRLGLLSAAERYRPRAHGGTPFEAYARVWIRGAILSAVRREWSDGSGGHAVKPLTESLAAADFDIDIAVDETGAIEGAIDAERRAAAELAIPAARAYRLHNSGINALRARLA